MTRAVVFVRSDEFDPHATRCTIFCEEQGWEFYGLIVDDWDEAQRMYDEREADVIVVSEESHLPADRTPRIVVVANVADHHGRERTRIIRRV